MNNENISLYAFRKYGDTVLRASYSCCGNYAEAEDITQEVFLTLHIKSLTFNSDEHLKAWLLRTAINKCRNLKRSFRISRTQSLEDTDESSSAYTMNTAESDVREMLRKLPEKYASVIYLYYYEGYNIREISGILKKNTNTVSSLLQRGREKLRLEMEETS